MDGKCLSSSATDFDDQAQEDYVEEIGSKNQAGGELLRISSGRSS